MSILQTAREVVSTFVYLWLESPEARVIVLSSEADTPVMEPLLVPSCALCLPGIISLDSHKSLLS